MITLPSVISQRHPRPLIKLPPVLCGPAILFNGISTPFGLATCLQTPDTQFHFKFDGQLRPVGLLRCGFLRFEKNGATMTSIRIAGTGSYVPPNVVTNEMLIKGGLDTTDEWIAKRTGIRERRIAAPEMTTSDLAHQAALRALEMAGMKPQQLDMIIIGTVTPRHLLPVGGQSPAGQTGCPPSGCLRSHRRLFGIYIRNECRRTVPEKWRLSHCFDRRRGDHVAHAGLERPLLVRALGGRRRCRHLDLWRPGKRSPVVPYIQRRGPTGRTCCYPGGDPIPPPSPRRVPPRVATGSSWSRPI